MTWPSSPTAMMPAMRAPPLMRVQVALQPDQGLALGRRIAQLREQAVGMIEQVDAFLDEDVDEFCVQVGQVECFVRILGRNERLGEQSLDRASALAFRAFGIGLLGRGVLCLVDSASTRSASARSASTRSASTRSASARSASTRSASHVRLRRVRLRRVRLRRVRLRRVRLRHARLRHVRLRHVRLRRVRLRHARLRHVRLRRVRLRHVGFGAFGFGAFGFGRVRLRRVRLRGVASSAFGFGALALHARLFGVFQFETLVFEPLFFFDPRRFELLRFLGVDGRHGVVHVDSTRAMASGVSSAAVGLEWRYGIVGQQRRRHGCVAGQRCRQLEVDDFDAVGRRLQGCSAKSLGRHDAVDRRVGEVTVRTQVQRRNFVSQRIVMRPNDLMDVAGRQVAFGELGSGKLSRKAARRAASWT